MGSQRPSWLPLGAARHLHSWSSSHQDADAALNSDMCTMLIADFWISMWTSQRALQCTQAHVHAAQCDPVCGALASGYLEVSGGVVCACRSYHLFWGPAATLLTLLQSEGKVSVVSLPTWREQLGNCSLHSRLITDAFVTGCPEGALPPRQRRLRSRTSRIPPPDPGS